MNPDILYCGDKIIDSNDESNVDSDNILQFLEDPKMSCIFVVYVETTNNDDWKQLNEIMRLSPGCEFCKERHRSLNFISVKKGQKWSNHIVCTRLSCQSHISQQTSTPSKILSRSVVSDATTIKKIVHTFIENPRIDMSPDEERAVIFSICCAYKNL